MKIEAGKKYRVVGANQNYAGSVVTAVNKWSDVYWRFDTGVGHCLFSPDEVTLLDEEESSSRFWMVLGKGCPIVRHASENLAKREAERLAKANPGDAFVVLKAVSEVVSSEVKWKDLVDEVPF